MGLDWNPGPKAKPGCEQEFTELWRKLNSGRWCFGRERKVKRFSEITQTAFETLRTPRVGFDVAATNWARQMFPNRQDKSLTEDGFIGGMKGFYVLDLVPPCDGLPRYSNGQPGGYVERYSFRAQFLADCVEIIGQELLDAGYGSKAAEETIGHGGKLLERASQFAQAHRMDMSKLPPPEDPDSMQFHLDVVIAAGRWCRFWGEKGHWLEAYF